MTRLTSGKRLARSALLFLNALTGRRRQLKRTTSEEHTVCLEQSFAKLPEAASVTESETFNERLQQATETNRYEVLCDYVRQQVATVLRWKGEQPPDLQQGFFDLGMDSLSTLELKDRLQKGFATELPYTLI